MGKKDKGTLIAPSPMDAGGPGPDRFTEEHLEKMEKSVNQMFYIAIAAILLAVVWLLLVFSCGSVFSDDPTLPFFLGILIGALSLAMSLTGIVIGRKVKKESSVLVEDELRKKANRVFVISLAGLVLIILITLFVLFMLLVVFWLSGIEEISRYF